MFIAAWVSPAIALIGLMWRKSKPNSNLNWSKLVIYHARTGDPQFTELTDFPAPDEILEILSRFCTLLCSQNGSRRYTYLDLKGQDCIIGCATEDELRCLRKLC